MGFTVAGTASDSITEFPFIQVGQKCLYHQIGRKGIYLFYFFFDIRKENNNFSAMSVVDDRKRLYLWRCRMIVRSIDRESGLF